MDKPHSRYSPYSSNPSAPTPPIPSAPWRSSTPGTYGSRHTAGYSDVDTAVLDDRARYRRDYSADRGGYRHDAEADVQDHENYENYDDYEDDDCEDGVREYHDPIDRRWIWVAGVAGAILLVAVICTAVILGGGDSGSVSKTVVAPIPTTAQATSTPPTVVAAPPAPLTPAAPLSPETVTTVAPSPTATAAPPPAEPAPAVAAPSPRNVTYQVTGTRPLIDLVTVVYTDQQGALQTDFNVALPWTRTITLNPGVELSSVTATSLTGQLNCAITDSAGVPLVAQANNSMIATCTK